MHKVIWLVLRKMRLPLILLISAYSISVIGFVLIPGVDDNGESWRMDFFHAFYFVSYMATTIGFGELPYEFTEAQRAWTLVTIYLTVISWLYAIGKILTLVQEPALRSAFVHSRFLKRVSRIREPFYIVCGYGDTGGLATKALTERGTRVVAIDIDQERINGLLLDDLRVFVPGIAADAGDPETLIAAGLKSQHCIGILALTDDDRANLKVAITSKLLNPSLTVIGRAETLDTQLNMESFGTDHIINPFDAFAEQLAIALHTPAMHLIFEWLTQLPRTPLLTDDDPPRGTWIICGYGRFGKAVEKYLMYEGIGSVIVEAEPEKTGCVGKCVEGRGTEAVTLRAAKIDESVGIVAGTDDDANNLSILMTAKAINPNVYTVARQNRRRNSRIFNAADINQVMEHSVVLTLKILALLTAPLLDDFLRLAQRNDNEWARKLADDIQTVSDGIVPDIWTVELNLEQTPTILDAIEKNVMISIGHLITDPRKRRYQLQCLPLLLKRGEDFTLLPDVSDSVLPGDQILFCGRYGVAQMMEWTLNNFNTLRYVVTGETRPDGYVWRWIERRRKQKLQSE